MAISILPMEPKRSRCQTYTSGLIYYTVKLPVYYTARIPGLALSTINFISDKLPKPEIYLRTKNTIKNAVLVRVKKVSRFAVENTDKLAPLANGISAYVPQNIVESRAYTPGRSLLGKPGTCITWFRTAPSAEIRTVYEKSMRHFLFTLLNSTVFLTGYMTYNRHEFSFDKDCQEPSLINFQSVVIAVALLIPANMYLSKIFPYESTTKRDTRELLEKLHAFSEQQIEEVHQIDGPLETLLNEGGKRIDDLKSLKLSHMTVDQAELVTDLSKIFASKSHIFLKVAQNSLYSWGYSIVAEGTNRVVKNRPKEIEDCVEAFNNYRAHMGRQKMMVLADKIYKNRATILFNAVFWVSSLKYGDRLCAMTLSMLKHVITWIPSVGPTIASPLTALLERDVIKHSADLFARCIPCLPGMGGVVRSAASGATVTALSLTADYAPVAARFYTKGDHTVKRVEQVLGLFKKLQITVPLVDFQKALEDKVSGLEEVSDEKSAPNQRETHHAGSDLAGKMSEIVVGLDLFTESSPVALTIQHHALQFLSSLEGPLLRVAAGYCVERLEGLDNMFTLENLNKIIHTLYSGNQQRAVVDASVIEPDPDYDRLKETVTALLQSIVVEFTAGALEEVTLAFWQELKAGTDLMEKGNENTASYVQSIGNAMEYIPLIGKSAKNYTLSKLSAETQFAEDITVKLKQYIPLEIQEKLKERQSRKPAGLLK